MIKHNLLFLYRSALKYKGTFAWSTIGFQALRAASVNPVDSLKNS